MDYGSQMAQGSAINPAYLQQATMATQAQMPPTVPTLTNAFAGIDELNKRLRQLCSGANEIAHALGGPYPVGGQIKGADAAQPATVMQKLNESVNEAHASVSDLENAMTAIRRSLGA